MNLFRSSVAPLLAISILSNPVLFAAAKKSSELKTEKAKISYIIGHQIGTNFKRMEMDMDMTLLRQGIEEGQKGSKSLFAEAESKTIMENFQKTMEAKATQKAKEAGDKNKAEGKTFLDANAKKEGVKVLPSGLQYKVMTEGKGPKPKATDTVVTNYRGTLINGTEFDSSFKRKEPATFPVNGVIKGWTEALQLMPTGSKWQLFIPSDLAYGPRGAGQDIPPESTLIFEIELLSIKEEPKETPKPTDTPKK